jgi:hypothetical protein
MTRPSEINRLHVKGTRYHMKQRCRSHVVRFRENEGIRRYTKQAMRARGEIIGIRMTCPEAPLHGLTAQKRIALEIVLLHT